MRTGLTTVGLAGRSRRGSQAEDPTLADLLKPQGYHDRPGRQEPSRATATSILPALHGFDEFYGNLYHLNAEEEPEQPDYPRDRPVIPVSSSRRAGSWPARPRDTD